MLLFWIDCRDLLLKFLTPDPARRVTITEALNHPWIMQGSFTFSLLCGSCFFMWSDYCFNDHLFLFTHLISVNVFGFSRVKIKVIWQFTTEVSKMSELLNFLNLEDDNWLLFMIMHLQRSNILSLNQSKCSLTTGNIKSQRCRGRQWEQLTV